MAVEGTFGQTDQPGGKPGWFWRYSGGIALGGSIGFWAVAAVILYLSL